MLNTNVEPILSGLKSVYDDITILPLENALSWEIALSHVKNYPPDVILYNSVITGPACPSIDTFKHLKESAPLIHICFDASCYDWHPVLEKYQEEECFSFIVNIDGNTNWLHTSKDLTLLAPIDPKGFKQVTYKEYSERPIHFGFCGGNGSQQRREIIDALKEKEILTVRQREENLGSYQGYIDFLNSCKLILNMAQSGSGKSLQVKARVLEAGLAGCCLLEEKGSATSKWFTAGKDYIEYEDMSELKMWINYLKDQPFTAWNKAINLNHKVKEDHNPKMFWKKVLGSINKNEYI